MGGDDSQKLLPWRGIHSSPGRKPPALYEINTLTQNLKPDLPVQLFQRALLTWKIAAQFLASRPSARLRYCGSSACLIRRATTALL